MQKVKQFIANEIANRKASLQKLAAGPKPVIIDGQVHHIVQDSFNERYAGLIKNGGFTGQVAVLQSENGKSFGGTLEFYDKTQASIISAISSGGKYTANVLMVDLSPFSGVVKDMTADQIHVLLSGFYKYAIKIIHDHGGVVERLLGDAIIAVFGQPFTAHDATSRVQCVEASMQLLSKTYEYFNHELFSKCAIVEGEFYMGYIGALPHIELSMVGAPLTNLYRIENKLQKNEVVMYQTIADAHQTARPPGKPTIGVRPIWEWQRCDLGDLRGANPTPLAKLVYTPR